MGVTVLEDDDCIPAAVDLDNLDDDLSVVGSSRPSATRAGAVRKAMEVDVVEETVDLDSSTAGSSRQQPPRVPKRSAVEVLGDASSVAVTGVRKAPADPEAPKLEKCKLASVEVKSDSEDSSSSSSSSGSRTRRLSRQERLGAAAAAAVLSAAAPLDVDEAEKVTHTQITVPSKFAMRLQHEGGLIALMAETNTVIEVSPSAGDASKSVARISGKPEQAGRATVRLQEMCKDEADNDVAQVEAVKRRKREIEAALASGCDISEELEVPSAHFQAVLGAGGRNSLSAVRERCGGVMIVVQPSMVPGGPLLAMIGPGKAQHVLRAKEELSNRLTEALGGKAASAGAPKGPTGADVDAELRAVEEQVLLQMAAQAGARAAAAAAPAAGIRSATVAKPDPARSQPPAAREEPLIVQLEETQLSAAATDSAASGPRESTGKPSEVLESKLPVPSAPPTALGPQS
eukprot:TRINITY_DN45196_c0_g1_i1.p1 TRINITY_DN45196_c0_g1~~TRINITY_DN45196_c0_g1_i1.p1  ORF type:complete len:459 (-),score=98.07 TRINITY_DN45196_c0_g1_i1:140-1516(-)